MKNYDVIIAGAGPAGLSLAVELSKSDLDVLIIEKNKLGESDKVWYPFYEDMKKHKLQNRFDYTVSKIIVKNTKDLLEADTKVGYINSKKLLLALRKRFKKNIRILEKEKLLSAKSEKDYIKLKTSKQLFYTKLLVDCMGVYSPLPKRKNHLTYMELFCYEIKNQNIDDKKAVFTDLAFENTADSFWIEPSGKKKAWIGATRFSNKTKKESLKKSLARYLKKKNISGKPKKETYGLVPLISSENIIQDRLLFVGDSAAQAASSGFGLGSAMDDAKIAADFIFECFKKNKFSKKQLSFYRKKWIKSLGVNYYLSLITQKMQLNYTPAQFFSFISAITKIDKNIFVRGTRAAASKSDVLKMLEQRPKNIFRNIPLKDSLKIVYWFIRILIE